MCLFKVSIYLHVYVLLLLVVGGLIVQLHRQIRAFYGIEQVHVLFLYTFTCINMRENMMK